MRGECSELEESFLNLFLNLEIYCEIQEQVSIFIDNEMELANGVEIISHISYIFQTLNKERFQFSNINLKLFGQNFFYEAHKVKKKSDDTLIK